MINARLQGKNKSTGADVNIGGKGGEGAIGGSVDVVNSGRIDTTGSEAAGIAAASVGGGGGTGGLMLDMVLGTSGGRNSQQYKLNIGGSGGKGGSSSDVSVLNDTAGSIRTTGAKGYGILAESVGGGGGRGSSVISANILATSDASLAVNLVIGGVGGDGNRGGNVTVANRGLIETSGAGAHGIYAQSIGGGGGNGGMALAGVMGGLTLKSAQSVSVGGVGGDGGAGGDITVNNSGTIMHQRGGSRWHSRAIGGRRRRRCQLRAEHRQQRGGPRRELSERPPGHDRRRQGLEPAATLPSTTAATSPCSATMRRQSPRRA